MIDSTCADCATCTAAIGEYYMVHHSIWDRFGDRAHTGVLCVGCLEDRLGRELVRADFTDAPINTDAEDEHWSRSERLRSRLSVPSHLSAVSV